MPIAEIEALSREIADYPEGASLSAKTSIHIGRIRPITNICPVNKEQELINITIDYTPQDHFIELVSYRKRLQRGFADTLESIAEHLFKEVWDLINPCALAVTVYLEDEYLSDWHVRVDGHKAE